MRAIINNMMYSTENAHELYFDKPKRELEVGWALWKTNKGNYFLLNTMGEIHPMEALDAKEWLASRSIEAYCRNWEVEDA